LRQRRRLALLRSFEVVKRRAQERTRRPLERRDDLFVLIQAGAAAFFTDVDREVSPTEPDFGVLLGVASSHGLTVPLPAS
jgi:hypothetical protein